jgi:aldehyde:ferredoxin oxidoreductase
VSSGFQKRILRVNLENQKIRKEENDEVFYRKYFGGRGLISYYLLQELEPHIDPLSEKNKLIFACGPVTGAPISGAGRHSVGSKSPLTGGYGEAEAGGFWGTELKKSGYDAIIIEGRSKKPVYLWIKDDEVQIRNASSIWGKQILQTNQFIKNETNSELTKIAAIGPGGEKLVRFASIIHDLRHVSGRGGMGAVMGSKNLKAVAVKGTGQTKIARPLKLKTLAKWMAKNVDRLIPDLHTYGTGAAMDAYETLGALPVNNFREGVFPQADMISAQTIKKTISVGMETCFACVVRCKKIVKIDEGKWKVDPVYGGPEYETLAALGSNCGVHDITAICKANELCQRYSLDTISTGVTISYAMECFENGFLTPTQTGGIKLNFGNTESMLKIIELIGKRKGIGNLLAEGSKRTAKKLGLLTEKFAVQIKGQEVPMHDPRLRRGQGLGYAVSPTGADHMHNIYDTLYSQKIPHEIEGLGIIEPVPIEDMGPKKVRLFHYVSTWNSLDNSLCLCMFTPWNVKQKVAIVNYVTGWTTSSFELMKVSERATNLARIFNIREGFTREDDNLPSRLMDPKINGALSNASININDLEKAKDIYYKIAGWDTFGIPISEKLNELEIAWAATKLDL